MKGKRSGGDTSPWHDPTCRRKRHPLDPPLLFTELRDQLGSRLVAYLCDLKETRAVRQVAGRRIDFGCRRVPTQRPWSRKRKDAVIQAGFKT